VGGGGGGGMFGLISSGPGGGFIKVPKDRLGSRMNGRRAAPAVKSKAVKSILPSNDCIRKTAAGRFAVPYVPGKWIDC